MNLEDKITFVLYTSTKGHFGYKDCFKETVDRLESLLKKSYKKLCHVKISPGEQDLFLEMESWLEKRGWRVISTVGDWTHNDKKRSHWKEYYKDKLKCFSNPLVRNSPFSMWIEDDELISSDDFEENLSEAIKLLEQEKDVLCVRINREENSTLENSKRISDNIYVQRENYTQYGPTVTFQPTIARSLEWYHVLRLINQNSHLLESIHCELLSGMTFFNFSDSRECFAFFDYKVVGTKHIGTQEEINLRNC